jgi:2,4-dienoyl-CoA reductase-like NADH-dependent reductase (Old Yellow Enzyme family)/thioredoxin reductase
MNHFPHLFSSHKIGRLTLKNRIIMAPIDTNMADEEGKVTDALLAFYARRSTGGVGLIIVENSQIDYPTGKNTIRQLAVDHEDKIPGLEKLSQTIHDGGALAALQIHHAGRETTLEVTGGKTPVAPSAIPCGHLKTPVRELTRQNIEVLVDKFISAAGLAKQAGFDMVEIHGAHGYLVGEFLSPYTNKRSDEYGGSFYKRMRFAMDIVYGIKDALGKDFPISFRFSADEFIPGGITLKESTQIARQLEKTGVDVLHVSAGIYESLPTLLEPMSYVQGWRSYLAATIKKAVRIPVIAVGVIREPSFADLIISSEQADFVAIGRGLLADSHWPKKAEEGRISEIQRCIGCNEGCLNKRLTKSIQCSVNPETGREHYFQISPSRGKKRRIVVVGGGPAGLEASRVAALRKFEVILFEKNDRLGGQMRLASIPPGKDKIAWTTEYYEYQMKHLGVDVRTECNARPADILDTEPDFVVIATGSSAWKPPELESYPFLFTPDEILSSLNFSAPKTAAVVGAGGIGCETALFLNKKGVDVVLFEQLDEIALDVESITAWDLKEQIHKAGIKKNLNNHVLTIKNDMLYIRKANGENIKASFDLIVWAAGRTSNRNLVAELQKTSPPFQMHVIGDAHLVGKIHNAIHEAYMLLVEL